MKDRKDLRDAIVVTEYDEKPRVKIFSVRRVISYNPEEYNCRGALVSDPSGNESEGLSLAKRLFEIEGVEYVGIKQYDIVVMIGRAFHWRLDSLQLKIFAQIKGYLRNFVMMDDISEKNAKKKPESEK